MVEYRYNQPYYQLQLSELDEDVVKVLSFEGEEKISRLFEYRFDLLSEDPELDPDSILNKKATFVITRGDDDPINIHGIISHFEQRGRTTDYVSYFAVLVPQTWRLLLNFRSEVYQEMTVEQIITQVLEDAGFSSGTDFEFSLSESYPELEFIVQFQETDFDFINRRLEHFGIYYYFDHADDVDKIVFIDGNESIPAIEQEDDIFYNPNKDPLSESETINQFFFQGKVVTGSTKLKDYNYRFPSKKLLAESQLNSDAPGTYYNYGEHFKDENEGGFLARVRNEELLSKSKIFVGTSDCRLFRSCRKFQMGRHYRDNWNDEYILTQIYSRGTQSGLFGIMQSSKNVIPTFENSFQAIPPDMVYRPERVTPKPKIYGIMNAKIDASGDGEYAEIDDQGRYKVIIPFDLSDRGDGGASRFMRMAQPYAGADYGFHFPLHKGIEVILTFVDGDPDRPIIASAIPNPETMSPTTGGNQTQSVIRTGGGNEIKIEDSDGGQQIALSSPTEDSKISIGAPNEGNIFLRTAGSLVKRVVGPEDKSVDGPVVRVYGQTYRSDVDGEAKYTYRNDVLRRTIGITNEEFIGVKNAKCYAASNEEFVGVKNSKSLAVTNEEFVGAKNSTCFAACNEMFHGVKITTNLSAVNETTVGVKNTTNVAATNETFVGIKRSDHTGMKIDNFSGASISNAAGTTLAKSSAKSLYTAPTVDIEATAQINIKCGGSAIFVKPSEIVLRSSRIVLDGSGATLEAGSGEVSIDADAFIDGKTKIMKDLYVAEDIKNDNLQAM